jgi:hypothetical protein
VKEDGERYCDVCGEVIPKGETYRAANCKPEAARMLWALAEVGDPPTFTRNTDGTVRLDICLGCHGGMGNASLPTTESVNWGEAMSLGRNSLDAVRVLRGRDRPRARRTHALVRVSVLRR